MRSRKRCKVGAVMTIGIAMVLSVLNFGPGNLFAGEYELPYALEFDGDGDRVRVEGTQNGFQHFLDGRGTICLWVKPAVILETGSKNDRQFAVSTSGSIGLQRDFNIGLRNDGKWWVRMHDGSDRMFRANLPKPEAGEWYHLAVVLGGEDRGLYINGEKKASWDEFSGNKGPWQHDIHFGYSPDENRDWHGGIREVRFYDRNLVSSEVRVVMQDESVNAGEDGLVGHWPMDEGEGDIVHDRSDNARHGKIAGAKWGIAESKVLAEPPEKVLPALLESARGSNLLRGHALRTLGKLNVGKEEVVPVLLSVLEDSEETNDVRRAALDGVKALDDAGDYVTSSLLGVLTDEKDPRKVRSEAAKVLMQVNPEASEQALPKLKEQLDQPEHRSAAMHVLLTIGTDEALEPLDNLVEVLISEMQGEDPRERWLAVRQFSRLPPLEKDATEEMRLKLKQAKQAAEEVKQDVDREVKFDVGRVDASRLKDALIAWIEREIVIAKASVNEEAFTRFKQALSQAKEKDAASFKPQKNDVVPHFPAINDNPYAKAFIKAREEAEYSCAVNERDDLRLGSNVPGTWAFRRGVWDLCSPQSPFYLSPAYLKSVLANWEAIMSFQQDGNFGYRDSNMNRFAWSSINHAYLMFASTFPHLLPEVLCDYYEEQVLLGAKHLIDGFDPEIYEWDKLKKRWKRATARADYGLAYWYPNIDATYALGLYLAGRILQDHPEYSNDAEDFITLAEHRVRRLAQIADPAYPRDTESGVQFPDGGWTYMGFTNPSLHYHSVLLRRLVLYWQVSGSKWAHKALLNSAPYYPLSVESAGVGLDSSPYWKYYGTKEKTPGEVDIIVAIAECPFNKALADEIARHKGYTGASLLSASIYDPDIEPADLPDDFLIFDRNIVGPRGRFGRWSFTATGRDTRRDRGKSTYVNAMVTAEDPDYSPVSGNLKRVAFEYLEPPDQRRRWISMGDRTGGSEISRTYMHEKGAAFTVKTHFQKPKGGRGRHLCNSLPWTQSQIWIMTEDRLVGHMELYPGGERKSYGREAVINLSSDRHDEIERVNEQKEGEWQVGELVVRVIDHNFDKIELVESWDGVSALQIRLKDAEWGTKLDHSSEDPRFVTLECRPEWSPSAESIDFGKDAQGCHILKVKGAEYDMSLVFDPETADSYMQGAGSHLDPPPTYPDVFRTDNNK